MSNKNRLSIPDIADRHRRFMAFALLAISLMFLSKAAPALVSETIAFYMDGVQIVMALVAVGLMTPMLLWKIRRPAKGERLVYFSNDGYAAQALIFAQKTSWVITFVALVLMETLSNTLSRYPGEFLVQLTLAIMLGTMSLLFLYRTWPNEGLELEEEGGASHA